MPRLSEQILIPHTPENLYDLVKDVRRYPEFIRWITRLDVTDETEDSGIYTCTGTVNVAFKGFQERFSTHVKADPAKRQIDVKLARGPFRHLRNRWTFQPIGELETRIHFHIDYEFKNPVLSLLARANTALAVEKIIQSYRVEADRRYG